MFLKLVEDLRFVIGVFFAIVSLILLSLGIFDAPTDPAALNLNLTVGIVMIIFATFMIGFSIKSARH